MLKETFVTLLLLCCLLGCTMSPGRKLIAKGDIEPELAISALLGNPEEGFPAVPNVNIGVRYGLADFLNIGVSANPLTLLVEGTVMVEPYAVVRLLTQKRLQPAANLHIALPTLISPPEREATCFPLFGVTPSYAKGRSMYYLTFEMSFDSEMYGERIDPHVTLRGGWDFALKPWLGLVVEGGLANIGRESVITNAAFGQPILGLGLSYSIQRKKGALK